MGVEGSTATLFVEEDARQFDDIGAATKVGSLGEVAVGQYLALAEMDEMGTRGIAARHVHHIVVSPGRQTTGTEGQTVVRIVDSREQPVDVVGRVDDAWQS